MQLIASQGLEESEYKLLALKFELVKGWQKHSRHLIVHSEKEPNWLLSERKSQIGYKFGERVKLAINSEKDPNYLSIQRLSQI